VNDSRTGDERRPLRELGDEPDARFTFANERTYLAWNRTALACVVAGLAVTNVLTPDRDDVLPKVVGVSLMVLGLLLAGVSYWNWYLSERALRLKRPLPHSPMLLVLSIVTALVAVATAIMTFT